MYDILYLQVQEEAAAPVAAQGNCSDENRQVCTQLIRDSMCVVHISLCEDQKSHVRHSV